MFVTNHEKVNIENVKEFTKTDVVDFMKYDIQYTEAFNNKLLQLLTNLTNGEVELDSFRDDCVTSTTGWPKTERKKGPVFEPLITITEKEKESIKRFEKLIKGGYQLSGKVTIKKLCSNLDIIWKQLPLLVIKMGNGNVTVDEAYEALTNVSSSIYDAIQRIEDLNESLVAFKRYPDHHDCYDCGRRFDCDWDHYCSDCDKGST